MRTLSVIAAAAAALLLAQPAAADPGSKRQAGIMKQKLAAAKGPGAVVPTGFEIAGCTFYELGARGAQSYCERNETANQKRFWRDWDRDAAGASGSATGE